MRTAVLTSILIATLLGVLPGAGGAQPHFPEFFATGLAHLYHVDTLGKVSSVFFPGIVSAATMNWDNRTVLVHDFVNSSILRVDPQALTVLGTHVTHPSLNDISSVLSMEYDHNGDLFFTSTQPLVGVFKIDAGLNLSTVKAAASTLAPFANVGDLTVDIDSGDLIVADADPVLGQPLYLLRRDGLAYSTLGTGFNFSFGTQKHILTSDIYSGTCCGSSLSTGQSVLVLRAGTSQATVYLNHPLLRAGWGPCMDRASAPSPQFHTGAWDDPQTPGSDGIWRVDILSSTPTRVTSINNPGFGNIYHVLPVFERNLQSVQVGQGLWDIHLNCSGQGSKSFIIALGLSGVRPAVPLQDGRRIPLVPDVLTVATLYSLLPGVLTGHVGSLVNGAAKARLDVTMFGNSLGGIPIWIGAVVLDPAAPLGIAVIPDSKILIL